MSYSTEHFVTPSDFSIRLRVGKFPRVLSLKKLGAPSHHLPISLIPSVSLPPHSP